MHPPPVKSRLSTILPARYRDAGCPIGASGSPPRSTREDRRQAARRMDPCTTCSSPGGSGCLAGTWARGRYLQDTGGLMIGGGCSRPTWEPLSPQGYCWLATARLAHPGTPRGRQHASGGGCDVARLGPVVWSTERQSRLSSQRVPPPSLPGSGGGGGGRTRCRVWQRCGPDPDWGCVP